jgi:hypothetical protein
MNKDLDFAQLQDDLKDYTRLNIKNDNLYLTDEAGGYYKAYHTIKNTLLGIEKQLELEADSEISTDSDDLDSFVLDLNIGGKTNKTFKHEIIK